MRTYRLKRWLRFNMPILVLLGIVALGTLLAGLILSNCPCVCASDAPPTRRTLHRAGPGHH